MKRVFIFKWIRLWILNDRLATRLSNDHPRRGTKCPGLLPPSLRRGGSAPSSTPVWLSTARMGLMPEALDVTCPCCQALLKLDPETGTVVWADKKKAPAKDFDDLVQRVEAQRSVLDQKFARSVQQTKRASEILDKKFEEARRRAEQDPTTKAPHPFDNE